MKKTIMTLLILCISIPAAFAVEQNRDEEGDFWWKRYKITITNLTKGQPMTPPVVATHSYRTELYTLGKEASQGLKELSQDGVTATLVEELENNDLVHNHAVGSGIILPGESYEMKIRVRGDNISLVSMLARTNDAFVGFNLSTRYIKHAPRVSFLANVYDSGAENNTESCAHIPAPPCGNPGVGTDGGEGIVHPHPGIQNIGDLDPLRDAFAFKVAKITIERDD